MRFLSLNPDKIKEFMAKRLTSNKPTSFTMRLTPGDYKRLEAMSATADMSMTRFVRMKVGL